MKHFRFRLQTLRRLREIHRDEQRERLATALEAERILARQQEALAAESAELAGAQRRLLHAGPLDVNQLLTAQRYQLSLEAQRRAAADQSVRLADEVERRRQAAVEADREVRVLDKLEEAQRRNYAQAAQRQEVKRMDEIASTRWEAPPQ
jgi:flagellar FliJ protein